MRKLRLMALVFLACGLGFTGYAQDSSAKPSVAEKIAADANKLDLNTATAEQLRALPGMGDAYVKRIIEGRPYTAKNQLTTRGILPPDAYEKIKDQVIAHRVKK
jgi:DNA uptake protein ComE-like DNA-binding protein